MNESDNCLTLASETDSAEARSSLMDDTRNLIAFEEAEMEAAEASLLSRPHGGILDRLIANEVERLGFSREEIIEIMGHNPYIDTENSKN